MSITFGGLLAGQSDERHETFQHLQACRLDADTAARVASLLEALGGSQKQLRAAHSAWGYAQREHGRPVNAENMKDALRQKLLSLLPSVPMVALWELVPENAQVQLSPYQAVYVPAVDVRKLVRALPFLGTIARNMNGDFKKVCSEWKVVVRQQKRERPRQELQVDLCNACVQFLAERMDSVVSPAQEAGSALTSQREVSVSPVTDNRVAESSAAATVALPSTEPSVSAGMVSEDVRTAVVSGNVSMAGQVTAENLSDGVTSVQPEDVRTLSTALAMVRQKHMARRTRVTGKKQAVSAIPVDLSEAIETLHIIMAP